LRYCGLRVGEAGVPGVNQTARLDDHVTSSHATPSIDQKVQIRTKSKQ